MKKTATITIEQLSDTEYDLTAKKGGHTVLDAHLSRAVNLPSKVWLLDVFNSGKTTSEAHAGTYESGFSKEPNWREVINMLTDLLK